MQKCAVISPLFIKVICAFILVYTDETAKNKVTPHWLVPPMTNNKISQTTNKNVPPNTNKKVPPKITKNTTIEQDDNDSATNYDPENDPFIEVYSDKKFV